MEEVEIIQSMTKVAVELKRAADNNDWGLVGAIAQTAKLSCLRAERSELLCVFLGIQGALARNDYQACKDIIRDDLLVTLARLRRLQATSPNNFQ